MARPSLAGRLLVATPLLEDPNFARTVVYLCFHDENGAFGLVLNRAQEARAADAAPAWAEFVSSPAALFVGGPVQPNSVLGLARVRQEAPLEWWTPVADDVGLVNLAVDVHEAGPAIAALRIFHGYSGWGSGQLEGEIAQDAWFVVDAEPDDPFTNNPGALWQRVLRRQHGDIAIYGTYPADPSVN